MFKDTSLASETRRQERLRKEKEKEEEKVKKELAELAETSISSDDLDIIKEQLDTFESKINVEQFTKSKISAKLGTGSTNAAGSEKISNALGEAFR